MCIRDRAGPLAAHSSAVYQNAALFARIEALHAHRAELGLQAEPLRLLERTHLAFVRAGARLPAAARERHAQIMEELAGLTTRFAQNVLHDESSWYLDLPDEAALAGLPGFVRAAAGQAAASRGLAGHVIGLSRSLVMPFLSFSTRRDLREQVWRAWTGRGEHAGEHDNREVARDILRLRRELATLHGHACYADHALTDTMARSRAAVQELLDEVWPRALAAVEQERAELLSVMQAEGVDQDIEAWDWRFWAEKVRLQRYALDDAEIKPYFALERVAEAAFDCAWRLFGLRFTPRPDLPVYHPDVKAYEVSDAGGQVVGVFLQDNFARPNKRSGAWMLSLIHILHRHLDLHRTPGQRRQRLGLRCRQLPDGQVAQACHLGLQRRPPDGAGAAVAVDRDPARAAASLGQATLIGLSHLHPVQQLAGEVVLPEVGLVAVRQAAGELQGATVIAGGNLQRKGQQAHHHPLFGFGRVQGQRERMVRVKRSVHVGNLQCRLVDRGLDGHQACTPLREGWASGAAGQGTARGMDGVDRGATAHCATAAGPGPGEGGIIVTFAGRCRHLEVEDEAHPFCARRRLAAWRRLGSGPDHAGQAGRHTGQTGCKTGCQAGRQAGRSGRQDSADGRQRQHQRAHHDAR